MQEAPKCRIIILAAWRINEEKFWLQKELENLGLNVTTLDISNYNIKNRVSKWREILLWMDYLKLAWPGVGRAQHSEGVVLACNFTVGVFASVDVFFDTSEEEFYSMAARSRLVMLPLVGKVTAGLIVLIRSILMGKMVIATDTPATAPYYPNDCHDILVPESDVETMISRLKYYWINPTNRTNKAIKLQSHVLQHFSPKAYANQVSNLSGKFYTAAQILPEVKAFQR